MIARINGAILSEPAKDGFMGWLNGVGDRFIEWESESIVKPFGAVIQAAAKNGFHGIADIMPELATLGVLICVTIGMFTNFGKWAARAAGIYLGGAVWIILANT